MLRGLLPSGMSDQWGDGARASEPQRASCGAFSPSTEASGMPECSIRTTFFTLHALIRRCGTIDGLGNWGWVDLLNDFMLFEEEESRKV